MSTENDEGRLSLALSRLLLAGLLLSIALMLTGAVLAASGARGSLMHRSSLAGLLRALADLEPGGFFTLGLLVLLATPIARVAVLSVSLARRRAWLLAGIGLLVLAALALSAFLGLTND